MRSRGSATLAVATVVALLGATSALAGSDSTPAPRYYFHGTVTDDVSRAGGTPSATFDAVPPTGSSAATQTGIVSGNPNQPANRVSVQWLSTAYTGPINGTVSFDWYWSTADARAITPGDTVTVTIYADVDPAANTGTRIGKGTANIQVGLTPVLNHTEIRNVYGFATTNLMIQVTTGSVDTVHYGSISTPSSFTLPPAVPRGWSLTSGPNPVDSQSNYLRSVDCVTDSDCWAVGFYQHEPDFAFRTLIEHYDGTAWSVVSSPNIGSPANGILFGVSCASADRCWAVGYGVDAGIFQTLIVQYDGTSWAIVSSPNPAGSSSSFLNGVTCVSVDDCWAVGNHFSPGNPQQTLIEHFDGTAWSIVESANTSPSQHNVLYGVTCVDASDCWVVGSYTNGGNSQTLSLHYDGTAWSVVPSPSTSPSRSNDLYDVTCVSADDCWAIGNHYAGGAGPSGAFWDTLVLHYNGTAWSVAGSPSPGSYGNHLWGVTCAGAGDCWIAGHYSNGPGAGSETVIMRNTGSGWTLASPEARTHQNSLLFGIACGGEGHDAGEDACWAVGHFNDDCEGCVDQTLIETRQLVPSSATP